MSRPVKQRKVFKPPMMKGFVPYGLPACELESVRLSIEEYESIRLAGYKGLSHEEASREMNISRPTFTRIYNQAVKTISKAFAENMAVVIDGGKFVFDGDWYRCKKCYKLIQGLQNHTPCINCKDYSNSELLSLNQS